eukprot:197305-Rhodomonas_salina.1
MTEFLTKTVLRWQRLNQEAKEVPFLRSCAHRRGKGEVLLEVRLHFRETCFGKVLRARAAHDADAAGIELRVALLGGRRHLFLFPDELWLILSLSLNQCPSSIHHVISAPHLAFGLDPAKALKFSGGARKSFL